MTTYALAIGSYVKNVRMKHDLTLEAVANAGRNFGATWTIGSIRNLELGKMAPSLPNILILALAIGQLTGTPISLSELLGEATELDLPSTDGEAIKRDWVNAALSGEKISPPDNTSNQGANASSPDPEHELANRVSEPGKKLPGMGNWDTYDWANHKIGRLIDGEIELVDEISSTDIAEYLRAFESGEEELPTSGNLSLAEERAAKKIGTSPRMIRMISQILWGRTLEEEAAQRAGENSTPQARGFQTRRLLKDIAISLGLNGSST